MHWNELDTIAEADQHANLCMMEGVHPHNENTRLQNKQVSRAPRLHIFCAWRKHLHESRKFRTSYT